MTIVAERLSLWRDNLLTLDVELGHFLDDSYGHEFIYVKTVF